MPRLYAQQRWNFRRVVHAVKRFTATEKWDDPWFWELSPAAKLLWQFLCDHCDHAGIIEVNFRFTTMKIGLPIEECHLSELQSRLHQLPCGKFLIVGFIGFQYGTPSRECKPHNPIFASLSKHGVDITQIETLSKGIVNPLPKGMDTTKDKDKDKEKEEDKTSTGGVGGDDGFNPTPINVMKAKLCSWFNRRLTTPWSDKEDRAMRSVMALKTPPEDLEALESYYKSNDQYRRRDILTLLNNWNGEIDRAKGKRNGASKPAESHQMQEVIEVRNFPMP